MTEQEIRAVNVFVLISAMMNGALQLCVLIVLRSRPLVLRPVNPSVSANGLVST